MTQVFGQQISQGILDSSFLTVPGEDLVAKTLLQMSQVPQFTQLFGPYTPAKPGLNQPQTQRWADYDRFDWSMRQLPAINIYEAETEDKTSSNAWLNGTINIMTLWPASFRRSDLARVPMTYRGILLNFFESTLCQNMLDEIYFNQRPEKVYGLNEYGKTLTWSPNVEGLVESEMVPVTLLSVRYRIDLRAWYRALEFQNRTKGQPFATTLSDLSVIGGNYEGVTDNEGQDVAIDVPDEFTVTNP